MQRSKVVLPEPLGPITTTTCLRLTERSTPFRTVRLPKRLMTFSASTISCGIFPLCCDELIRIPSLASAHQGTSATAGAKAQHAFGPPFSLLDLGPGAAVGVQALLDPVLDKAPERGHEQIVQGSKYE